MIWLGGQFHCHACGTHQVSVWGLETTDPGRPFECAACGAPEAWAEGGHHQWADVPPRVASQIAWAELWALQLRRTMH